MTQLATRKTKLGNVVKAELWGSHGYERDSLTVLATATMEIGTVVKDDLDGTYSTVVAADVATLPTDVAIVIDDTVYEGDYSTPADAALACLHGGAGASGAAIVVREQLKFGDALSEGQIDTVVAALEARGISVRSQA